MVEVEKLQLPAIAAFNNQYMVENRITLPEFFERFVRSILKNELKLFLKLLT